MMARVEVITGPERRAAERRCRRSQLRLMPARRIAEISPGLPAAGGGRHLVLGVSEWTFGTLLFLGFWNRKLGILGALGSSATFIATVTIIPFMPDGWDAAAGGFPAMTGNVPFLMKDVVLLATSLYLLTQDLRRELLSTGTGE